MSTTPGRLVRAFAAAAILALAATTAPATAADDVDGPDYQKPVVGECHNYGIETSASPSDASAVVDCAAAHTALTVAVVPVPAGLDFADEQSGDPAFTRTLFRALTPCAAAARKAFGANYQKIRMTAYDWTFYRPTDDQLSHGARWLRCDVNLFGGRKLQALPSGTNVKIGKVSQAEQACRVWVSDQSTAMTGCGSKHQFRAVKVFRVPGAKFPTDKKFLAVADKKCTSVTGKHWWVTWPSPAGWADGDHLITCFKPNKH